MGKSAVTCPDNALGSETLDFRWTPSITNSVTTSSMSQKIFSVSLSQINDCSESEHSSRWLPLNSEPSETMKIPTFEVYQLTLLCAMTLIVVLVSTLLLIRRLNPNSLFRQFLELVLCYVIIIPCLPGLAIYYSGCCLIRGVLQFYLDVFDGQHNRRSLASPSDAFWFYEKYASSSASIGLYIVKGRCDLRKIQERVHRVATSELVGDKMMCKAVQFCGFPCWEKVDFDIQKHVKLRMNRGSDYPLSEAELFQFMSTFQDQVIVDKPPWEVLVIPHMKYHDYDNSADTDQSSTSDYYAVIFRLHHGIMDGVSSGNILHSILADEPFEFTLDPVHNDLSQRSSLLTFGLYLSALLLLPRTGLMNLLRLDNRNNRWFAPGPSLTGTKKFSWTRPINVDALRQIKNKTNTSVYAVMSSCMGGSVQRIHIDQCKKSGRNPNDETIHVLSPLAMLPYPNRKPRNGFSGMVLPVPVSEDVTTEQRLKSMFNSLKEISYIKILGYYYLILMLGLSPSFIHKIIAPLVYMKTTLSNIPGPKGTVKIFDGDSIIDIGTWVPIKFSVGLGFALFSYAGRVRVTVITDNVSYTEDENDLLVQEFENELRRLCQLAEIDTDLLFV